MIHYMLFTIATIAAIILGAVLGTVFTAGLIGIWGAVIGGTIAGAFAIDWVKGELADEF